jgi:predicted transcriptional regulator
MVRRDRHDIATEILRKAAVGKKKTELMLDVGLSYAQTKLYLDTLVKKGLLETNESRLLKTTKKGLEFLERCTECMLFPWEKSEKESL